MAIFVTAVVAAVTADVVTVALVATAVADTGIALSVVGAVTGNKTISEVGGVMALAGGAAGLADGMFGTTTAATVGGTGTAGTVGAAGSVMGPVAGTTDTIAADGSIAGANYAADAGAVAPATISSSVDAPSLDTGINASGINPGGQVPIQPGGDNPNADMLQNGSSSIGNPSAATGLPSSSPVNLANSSSLMDGTANPAALAAPASSTPTGLSQWYNGLDATTKAHVALVAGQGVSAMVGGLFNGWSASQKLALAQQQQNLVQTQYTTAMANANSQPTIAAYKAPAATGSVQPGTPVAGTGLLQSTIGSNT